MARRLAHVIHDILEAIERIEEITRGKSLGDFEASWQMRWLERAIETWQRLDPKSLGGRSAGSATCCGTITKACLIASYGMWSLMNCQV